ncbi:hypothetical protein BASA60_005823 [Batrachochytrium salamandrivorans]|nr:hypothetical protein BASA60_005823 [Batrachochytrium salamandrivorans]
MRFSTGIILSALAFSVFDATPTSINPSSLLSRRALEPTMTGSLWKRNNGDEEEGAAQSSPESDASASGGSSRSDRSGGDDDHGPPRSSRLPTKTSFSSNITEGPCITDL